MDDELRKVERRAQQGDPGALLELSTLLRRSGHRAWAYAAAWWAKTKGAAPGPDWRELGRELWREQREAIERLASFSDVRVAFRGRGDEPWAIDWDWRRPSSTIDDELPVMAVLGGGSSKRFPVYARLTTLIDARLCRVPHDACAWSMLTSLPCLTRLDVEDHWLTDEAVRGISALPLRALTLIACDRLTPQVFAAISAMPRLRLAVLNRCPQLTESEGRRTLRQDLVISRRLLGGFVSPSYRGFGTGH